MVKLGIAQSLNLSGRDDLKKYRLLNKLDQYYIKKESSFRF